MRVCLCVCVGAGCVLVSEWVYTTSVSIISGASVKVHTCTHTLL